MVDGNHSDQRNSGIEAKARRSTSWRREMGNRMDGAGWQEGGGASTNVVLVIPMQKGFPPVAGNP
jgi:hypothetical protein